jgi:hypothetical protein
MNEGWFVVWEEDPNQVLDKTIEEFYNHFSSLNETPPKSLVIEGLKHCVGVTKKGVLIIRSQSGLHKVKASELNTFLGGRCLRFMNEPGPVNESLAEFITGSKKILSLVKPV